MSKIKILSILPVIITLLCTLPLFSSGKEEEEMDYRTLMRDFVINISRYARTTNPSFIVIPQNGNELLCFTDWDPDGEPALEYINAIDGVGREDLFFGYTGDNIATPDEEKAYMLSYMVLADRIGLKALVIDYCSSKEKIDYSYSQNESYGFISFAANSRGLDTIPAYPVFNENNLDINSLQDARNFLFLINPGRYSRKEDFLAAIGETNYDIVIVDLYFTDEEILTADDILSLKRKKNGGQRLVIAYMSIGEAENYRYYWQESWYNKKDRPPWLLKENPYWEGNYKVQYWDPEWQAIIIGGEDSYLDKIIAAGFDGVYLDIIDAFEYFEN